MKAYNALTGAELKKVILSEVERELDNAGINSMASTYPLASWSWTFTLIQKVDDIPASDTPELVVEAGNKDAKDAKEDPGQKLLRLLGGSKRFQHNPPSPTEVRIDAKLPLPEA